MKIIKPSVIFFGAVPTDFKRTMKFIEQCGRTCYKSEDKITATSAKGFTSRLIKAGHLAMVEHSNLVVRYTAMASPGLIATIIAQKGKYLNLAGEANAAYVGGNLTAWAKTHEEIARLYGGDHPWDDSMFLPFLATYGKLFHMEAFSKESAWEIAPHNEIPKDLHRYSAKFFCDRGVSHEIVRHRPCSFAQESTRYVNYSGSDMQFIEPTDFENWPIALQRSFESACSVTEVAYNQLIGEGLKPQQARAVLSTALKTELVVTADGTEWAHIRKLRTDAAAHPDIQRVMNMMPWEEFLDG